MKTRLIIQLAIATVGTFLLTACVEFEEQRLSYNIEANELTIFQEYRGIHAKEIKISGEKKEKPKTSLSESEQKEIDSVMNSERTFFFGNWITEYNRNHLEEELVKYKEGKATPEDSAEQRDWIPLIELLLANVKVTNGDFYYDEKQRLSGYQVVRVTNLDQLTAQASRSISQWILNTDPTDSTVMTEQIRAMATADHPWVRHDRNKITISYPASAEEYAKMQKDNSGYTGSSESPVTTTYKDGVATIDIGSTDDAPVLISRTFDRPYTPIAVDYISSKYSIKKEIDIAGIKQAIFTLSDEQAAEQK
jgi:hypothetical protein